MSQKVKPKKQKNPKEIKNRIEKITNKESTNSKQQTEVPEREERKWSRGTIKGITQW